MCTIFSISKDSKILFGNNEDNIRKPNETFIAFIPSQKVPARWVYPDRDDIITSYGFVLVGVRKNDELFPQGGLNEHGLAYDINGLPPVNFNGVKGKSWKSGFNYFDLLMNTKKVDEVTEHFKSYEQSPRQWGAGQIHFADSSGKAAVMGIEEGGDLGFKFKGDENYLISTNFSLNNPKDKTGFPCRRYDTANKMLDSISNQKLVSMEDCAKVLDAVKIQYGKLEPNHGTVYANIFDLVERTIQLYHLDDFSNFRTFHLESELKKIINAKSTTEFRFRDNATEERFNFDSIKVHIIEDLFS